MKDSGVEECHTNKICLAALHNYERCLGMMVCTHTETHGCLDGWTDFLAGREVWVSALFSSLCLLKGDYGEAEAQTQASLSALKGFWSLVEKGHIDQQRA